MDTKTTTLIVTLVTILLNIGLALMHVPSTISCQVTKMLSATAYATSTN